MAINNRDYWGSFHFTGPEDVRSPYRETPAVAEVVALIALGPKSKKELSEGLGISENAVCKRLFRARRAGYAIKLNGNCLYWMDSRERVCKKCGKRLAKLNKDDCCYTCQMNGT